MATPWTLARIIDKVRDDLDLHAEDFVTSEDLTQFVNDAIDDAEEIVIDCFSDFLLTYEDLTVVSGENSVALPADIYESRIRGLYYSETGFDLANSEPYKLRQIPLREVGNSFAGDIYRYRLINSTADGQEIHVFPAFREDSDDRFRLWYIRAFKRMSLMSDILEKGIRPQFVLSHVKCAVMKKDGNALLDVETATLLKQEDKLKNSLSRLTDDDEGVLLEPDDYSLSEAYGDDY